MREHFDAGSLIIIALTLILFVAALFLTGFTKNLLLEIGVFLVSVKLIQMAYKNSVNAKVIQSDLEEIKSLLQQTLVERE